VSIISFTKVKLPYGWLGNMAPYPITYREQVYRTSEALFQALRFDDEVKRELIRTATSPMTAKMLAKNLAMYMTVKPRSDEDLENMAFVLNLKIEQHPELVPALLDTGDAQIIEDCSARPSESGLFWGAKRVGDGWEGENHLGRLWMAMRDLRKGVTVS
jgi:hypothetical protein